MSETPGLDACTARFPDEVLPDTACPNCRQRGVRTFYAVDGLPVHSCLLMDTRAEALGIARRDLVLALCGRCGFVFNVAFDPSVHDYSARYEETQAFSSTFNRFAASLAQRVVERYDVRNQTVLEIGCGKGQFLVLLCELGNNRGIGIDPAYVPERTSSEAAERIEFIRELFDERYTHLAADFVCCRHTLEHIAPTADFMELVCRTAANRPEGLVFFELPETLRILREGAFWDVYYEHSSYFTPGSLARLFRQSGLDPVQLELDYDDQYILIAGRQSASVGPGSLPLEDDLEETSQAVTDFAQVCGEALARWRTFVEEACREGRRVVLWGAGSKGVAFLTTLGLTDQIPCAVDINPHKQGKFMPCTGQEVISPASLAQVRPTDVIVMNPIYCEEIARTLAEVGVDARLMAV